MILKLITFLLCVFTSCKYSGQYGVVGFVFGLTVILWQTNFKTSSWTRQHGLFVVLSTLIYAIVRYLATIWDFDSDLLDMLAGSFPIAVIFGSVALPAAQVRLFRELKPRFKKVVKALILSYYGVVLVSYLVTDVLKIDRIDFSSVMIIIWQGLYLYFFFVRKET